MTTRSRLEAELATRRYTRRHAREIVTAILGNNAGTVVVTTDTRWYWIRLHGDANQVVRAWNAGFVPPVNNLPVDVEIIKANGITDYQIIGVSINKGVSADVYAGATGMHALQHQRRDFNAGGFDPLDIYARAIVQLRARAQATPDMTLYVEPGFYPVAGIATYFPGGNSAAFVAPGGGFRCDLLYLDNAGALQIVTGAVAPFGTPVRPAQPAATDLPLAYVYLTTTTTAITEYLIEDARVLFGTMPATMTPSAHNILSTSHGDTLAGTPVLGDIIAANGTPKWGKVSGNTTATLKFLSQLGTGAVSALPSWQVMPLGGSLQYYLQATASDVATYLKMLVVPYSAKTTLTVSSLGAGNTTLKNFVTDPGIPSLTFIPEGAFHFHIHAKRAAGTKDCVIYGELWESNSAGADVAKIGTTETTPPLTGSELEYDIAFATASPYTMAGITSRLTLRVICTVSGGGSAPDVSIYYGGVADSHFALPSQTVDVSNFVTSVNKSGGATLHGAITLSEGTNITLTQTGQNIAIASTGGAALTVKEEDGTPSVANVTEIRVTNGTLTDNTGGSVSLDFGSAATDGAAIHDNVAGEIAAITEKVTPVDADLVIIEDSADSNNKKKVQIGNLPGGAGGAPTTAEYVTTAADAGLSAEVAIPGFGAHPDRLAGPPTGGLAMEFNSGDTAPTWSAAPAADDIGVTFKSHFYCKSTDNTERFATWAWVPGAGAFDLRAELGFGFDTATNSLAFGLHVENSDRSKRLLIQLYTTGANNANLACYTYSGSYSQVATVALPGGLGAQQYVRITRDGSNNVKFFASVNGKLWVYLGTAALTLTISGVGFRLGPSSSGTFYGLSDWLRTDV